MDEAEYCHRVALMYRGQVIALGAPADLKRELSTHTLLRLDTPAPLDTMRALEEMPQVVLDVAVFGGGLHVTVDGSDSSGEAAMADIREKLTGRGIGIRRLEKILPSLEDVFVALIEAEERKAA
jgi:ABC-2 type transport system ATP-binding protein